MSHIVGEQVTLVTVTGGGGYDDDGYPIPSKEVKQVIDHCVVIPEGNAYQYTDDRFLEFREASVLIPSFVTVDANASVMIRGAKYVVARPAFDHKSAFGSALGGTEIYVKRVSG